MKRLPLFLIPMLAVTQTLPDLPHLQKMIARFAPTELRADLSKLSPGDRQSLAKLVEASRILNDIFRRQLWSGNEALYTQLQRDTSPLGKARLEYFLINKGPWSDLDDHAAFVPGAPSKKLPGANFYPEDMTRDEFETWAAKLPKAEQENARGFFTVIRRGPGHTLEIVPYNRAYAHDLQRAARLLEEAAALTPNPSLKKFLG